MEENAVPYLPDTDLTIVAFNAKDECNCSPLTEIKSVVQQKGACRGTLREPTVIEL
jgi:hypothetical protein